MRRRAQLLHVRPDLRMTDIRGNVDTRLRLLDAGEFAAIVLAEAGLTRLGLAHRITQVLPKEWMLPAVGQGALGLETRTADQRTRDIVRLARRCRYARGGGGGTCRTRDPPWRLPGTGGNLGTRGRRDSAVGRCGAGSTRNAPPRGPSGWRAPGCRDAWPTSGRAAVGSGSRGTHRPRPTSRVKAIGQRIAVAFATAHAVIYPAVRSRGVQDPSDSRRCCRTRLASGSWRSARIDHFLPFGEGCRCESANPAILTGAWS